MKIIQQAKAQILNQVLNYVSKSDGNIDKVLDLLKFFTKNPKQKENLERMKKGKQYAPVIAKFQKLSKNIKRRFIENLIVGYLIEGPRKRKRHLEKYGVKSPSFFVLCPSMRCNIRCVGCSAGEYTIDDDLPYPVVRRLLNECREMGISFLTISGGEPFIYPHFLQMAEEFPDIIFQVYTNGTFITDKVAKKIAELGNIVPAISVEGFEKETDFRRGKGMWKKILKAMENLRNNNCLFGFSFVSTSLNADLLSSDKFYDFFDKQGCAFGWHFTYIPIGLNPNTSLMASPEQRLKVSEKIREVRSRPDGVSLMLGDFWGDGPVTRHGCIAAAPQREGHAGYLQINCHGDVEPCGFVHFAVDNIKEKPLRDCLNSTFFKEFRKGQEKIKNKLAPCCIIDNPEILRNAVEKGKAYPTHHGAETIVSDKKIKEFLDSYSKKIFDKTKDDWNKKWCHRCGGRPV